MFGFYNKQKLRPMEKLIKETKCSSKKNKKNKSKKLKKINICINETNSYINKKFTTTNYCINIIGC